MNFVKALCLAVVISGCTQPTVDVNVDRVILRKGDSISVSATCPSETTSAPKWVSSNPFVVTANNGDFLGKGPRQAVVTVSCGEDSKQDIEVVVGVSSPNQPDVAFDAMSIAEQSEAENCRGSAARSCDTIGYGDNDICYLSFAQSCSREDDRAAFRQCVESFGLQPDGDCVLYWR